MGDREQWEQEEVERIMVKVSKRKRGKLHWASCGLQIWRYAKQIYGQAANGTDERGKIFQI